MGLRKWVQEKWVDIGAPKKDGKYQPCGRSKGSKRKYPKCVPLAKATQMTSSQKASAVRRKRAAGNTGPKPTNVATFAKRKKAAMGGYICLLYTSPSPRDVEESRMPSSA